MFIMFGLDGWGSIIYSLEKNRFICMYVFWIFIGNMNLVCIILEVFSVIK